MSALAAEMPGLKRYCTLSPIPGLRAWLTKVDTDALPESWPSRLRTRFAHALAALRLPGALPALRLVGRAVRMAAGSTGFGRDLPYVLQTLAELTEPAA